MSNNDSMVDMSPRTRLKAEVTYLMLKGAGYAAVLVLGIWLVIAVIAGIGRALPEQSRMAPDPAPQAFIEFAAREAAPAMVEEPAAEEAAPAAAEDAAAAEAPAEAAATEEAAPAAEETAPAE